MALFEDLRYGLRSMAKHPGFTASAVMALALGIGANAVVFAIIDRVLFRSMPFVSDNILYLGTKNLSRGQQRGGVSYPDFRDWKEQAKSFKHLGAYRFDQVNLSDKSGQVARYSLSRVTANTFSIIQQKPILGRDFTPDDERSGAAPVAILGYTLWDTRYGKNPSVIGQIVRVDGMPTTIIGVAQDGLRFPIDTDLWMPLVPEGSAEIAGGAEKRELRRLTAFGEMADGATQRSATAEMESIGHNLERAYPVTNQGVVPTIHTFGEEINGPQVKVLLMGLMGAVGFVLLIACANVASLLLARAVDRMREISIRIAIGAGRWRIIRQLLVESVLLSILGGAFGWLTGIWGIRVFSAAVHSQTPAWMTFSIDYRALVFLGIISVLTGLLFGLAPALQLSKLDVNTSLREGGRGSSGGKSGRILSGVLVVLEMSLAVVLLVGAGLMIRTVLNIYATKTGVNEKNVLVMRLDLPEAKYPKADDQIAFHKRLKTRLDALPGVDVSTIALTMPTGGSMQYPYELEHAQPVDEKRRPSLSVEVIGLDYFRAMDVHLLRGRVFTDNDGVSGPPVAIVNQRFAEKFWPGDDPIGKRLRTFENNVAQPWLTVVGVAPNILQNDITVHDFDPLIYIPYRQKPMRDMSIMARTLVNPSTMGSAFRKAVQAEDEDMPVYNLRSLEERLAINYWGEKVFGSLLGIFAVIALVLASLGLYAVIAHSVSQRTQEIGVRMALGASETNILHLILKQGMLQMGIGLAVGLAGAVGLTRVLKSILANVSPTDPLTFAAVALILSLAAVLGCLVPALRAMRVDPVIALRNE